MDRSMTILKVCIAFVVPFPSIQPNCSCAASGLVLFLFLFITNLSKIFVRWLIKLIVQCNSHSIAPNLLREPQQLAYKLCLLIGAKLAETIMSNIYIFLSIVVSCY